MTPFLLQWGGLDVDRVLYLLRIALNDLMTRSNSHIEPNFFLHLSQTFPKLSWMLLPGTTEPQTLLFLLYSDSLAEHQIIWPMSSRHDQPFSNSTSSCCSRSSSNGPKPLESTERASWAYFPLFMKRLPLL